MAEPAPAEVAGTGGAEPGSAMAAPTPALAPTPSGGAGEIDVAGVVTALKDVWKGGAGGPARLVAAGVEESWSTEPLPVKVVCVPLSVVRGESTYVVGGPLERVCGREGGNVRFV